MLQQVPSNVVALNTQADPSQAAQSVTEHIATVSTGYLPPELVALGALEVVQAGRGYYYDGPHTTWLRY